MRATILSFGRDLIFNSQLRLQEISRLLHALIVFASEMLTLPIQESEPKSCSPTQAGFYRTRITDGMTSKSNNVFGGRQQGGQFDNHIRTPSVFVLCDGLVVQLERESSNCLFDILQEWEAVLKTCDSLINTVTQDNDPRCGDEHFGT